MRKFIKTPTVFQMEATECGAASLSMIFSYYGKHVPLEQMRIETGVSRDGCNARNIMRAAKKFGFECRGFRRELKELLDLRPPCIIHWHFNHFVVFEGTKGKHAYINDPAVGRRRLDIDELDEGFTGVVLTFEKKESFTKSKKQNNWSGFVFERLKGQYQTLIKLVFVGLLLVFPGLIIPITSQLFIDDVLIGGNTAWFTQLLLFLFATVVVQSGLTYYRGQILLKLQSKMMLVSVHKFLSHLFRLPINFFDQRYAGDLTSRVDNNNSISSFLAGDLAETALNMLVALFYLALLLLYSPWLTLIGIIGLLANIVIVKISGAAISDSAMKMQQDSGKTAGVVFAGLSITGTIKASGVENEYVGRILGFYAKNINLEQRLNKLQQVLSSIPQVASHISGVLVMLFGGLFVIRGEMTIGSLVAFGALLGSFSEPANSLVGFVRDVQTLRADMARVADIAKYPEDSAFTHEGKADMARAKLSGALSVSDVTFGYSILEEPLIKDFRVQARCGESIAFVGASGCGKSTVSKLVSGLYGAWSGDLTFDGVALPSIPKEIISASVSTVSQNITLFSGTIRENLTMWNKNVLESDMIRAAKDACIHDTITQKPGAYDYALTENASNLSGGQRQRLEIARALVTNPTVLIMDEATSALDPIVEKQIIDNIKRRGCTCIVVAHRLSAIRDCDRIYVMEHGKIIQSGTHKEMSETDGLYKEFIRNI